MYYSNQLWRNPRILILHYTMLISLIKRLINIAIYIKILSQQRKTHNLHNIKCIPYSDMWAWDQTTPHSSGRSRRNYQPVWTFPCRKLGWFEPNIASFQLPRLPLYWVSCTFLKIMFYTHKQFLPCPHHKQVENMNRFFILFHSTLLVNLHLKIKKISIFTCPFFLIWARSLSISFMSAIAINLAFLTEEETLYFFT